MISARKRAMFAALFLCAASVYPRAADASPNVPLQDPVYERLETLRTLGRLLPYSGGLLPLNEQRAHELLILAGEQASFPWIEMVPRALWIRPLRRAEIEWRLFRDSARPYSLAVRPRNLVGSLSVSCERQEGRPCGRGFGTLWELDSEAGIGPWISVTTRIRGVAGTDSYDLSLELARAHLDAMVGPVAFEVGRDTFALGPSARARVTWSDNAPPLDLVRLSTAQPVDLIGKRGQALRATASYILGRLRAPQRYPGNLVSIGRVQLDVLNNVEVGMQQMLQLGGDGAPSLSFWDFIAEHVRRKDMSATETDTSNRRVSFDVSFRVPALPGTRLYYEIAFEDWRKQFDDALRYDADHLLGVELDSLGPGGRHGLVIELQQTGVRSQEHHPRTTGFTNAGRVVGSPLGPDALSIFAGGRIELGWATLKPWLELVRLSSDTYQFVDFGPILRTGTGPHERRYRGGALLRMPLGANLQLATELLFEHVSGFEFVPGKSRENVGITASVVWRPGWTLAGGE